MWCERDPVVQLGRSLNIGNVCIRVQRSHSFMFCTEVSNAGFRTATLLPLRLVGAALRQASFITIVSCTQEDASWWVVNRRQTCEWNPYSKQRVRERKQVCFFLLGCQTFAREVILGRVRLLSGGLLVPMLSDLAAAVSAVPSPLGFGTYWRHCMHVVFLPLPRGQFPLCF